MGSVASAVYHCVCFVPDCRLGMLSSRCILDNTMKMLKFVARK